MRYKTKIVLLSSISHITKVRVSGENSNLLAETTVSRATIAPSFLAFTKIAILNSLRTKITLEREVANICQDCQPDLRAICGLFIITCLAHLCLNCSADSEVDLTNRLHLDS